MEFRSGMLAVVLIVISLIASAGLGVVLNVDSKTITVEEPVFKSDITGLYQADKQETFIQNDVAANFNGYSWGDSTQYPVDFIPAGNANNYPITKAQEGPRDVDPFDLDTVPNIAWGDQSANYWRYVLYMNGWYTPQDIEIFGTKSQYTASPSDYIRLMRLTDVIPELYPDDTSNLESIRMSITISFAPIFPGTTKTLIDNMTAIAPLNTSTSGDFWLIRPAQYSVYDIRPSNNLLVSTVEYFMSTGKCTVYNGEVNPANLVGTYNDTDLYVYSVSQIRPQPTGTYGPIDVPNNNIHVEYIYDSGTQYIDPRYGVANVYEDTGVVSWKNGYINQRMDITMIGGVNTNLIPGYTGTEKMEIIDSNAYHNELIFYANILNNDFAFPKFKIITDSPAGGPLTVTVRNMSNETLGSLDLGTGWAGANIRYDGRAETISAQPIALSGWGNFLEWTSVQPYQHVSDIPTGTVMGFQINDPLDDTYSFRWQVSETYIFLNTYGVIMLDPKVDIRNWYPNNDRFMVSFTKTAATGKSITIGGQDFEVYLNEITVNGTKIDITEYNVTYELLSTEGDVNTWNIYIQSPKSNTSATIQGTTTEVQMEGAWYFNSAYYVIEDVDKQVYDWNFGELAFGLNVVFLFMMGFLALGAIAIWKLIPGMLTALDIGIVIIAEIILFFIAG